MSAVHGEEGAYQHSFHSPDPQADSAETGWTVHVPVHRLATLGRCGSNRRSAPTFEPSGQRVMPEAKRPACICRSATGVRVAVALRSTARSWRSCPGGIPMAGGGAPFAQGRRKTRQGNWQTGNAVPLRGGNPAV